MQRKELSFKGQKIFIGIDVHKDSWRVAIAPEVGMAKGHSQKPSAKELLEFLKKHYPEGEYHAIYESGFSGFSTYYALQETGIDCIVIHAADVPTTQYEETMKTDKDNANRMKHQTKMEISGIGEGNCKYFSSIYTGEIRRFILLFVRISVCENGGRKFRYPDIYRSAGVSKWCQIFLPYLHRKFMDSTFSTAYPISGWCQQVVSIRFSLSVTFLSNPFVAVCYRVN